MLGKEKETHGREFARKWEKSRQTWKVIIEYHV